MSIGIASVPAAIMLALLTRLPKSPRWLVRRDDDDGARSVLQRVRPSGYDVDGELDEMAELARKEQTASTRGWSGLRERWVRPSSATRRHQPDAEAPTKVVTLRAAIGVTDRVEQHAHG